MAPHADQDAECSICANVAASGPDTIWEDSRWLCAHCDPAPLPGWLMFYSQRHVQGPAKFNSDEAANFGLAVRHIEQKLEELTGALRIYTVAFGESTAHLHAHLIPRYAGLAPGASADKLFEGYAFGIAGEQCSELAVAAPQNTPPRAPRVCMAYSAVGIADLARDVMGQPRDGGAPFPAADAAKVARISNELRDALAADPPPSVTGTLSFAYALDYCALILLPDSAQWLQSGLLASLLENYNWPPWQDVRTTPHRVWRGRSCSIRSANTCQVQMNVDSRSYLRVRLLLAAFVVVSRGLDAGAALVVQLSGEPHEQRAQEKNFPAPTGHIPQLGEE